MSVLANRFAAGAAAALLTPLNVVWFAGGGGSSAGMAQAGFAPDYALNHNATALWMHQVNHPECVHLCDDATSVHPMTLEPGRRIRAFWASPDCTHFSIARGSAPKSPRIRGLAWCIIPWAKLRRPDVIFIENVKEFTTWGPLDAHGKPIKKRQGETFKRFIRRLEQAGYTVEWKVLNAADYGAPTTRKRLFILARSDGEAIVWPERTHAPRREAAALGLLPYASAASIIDWSERCPSIFMSSAEAKAEGLKIKRPLVDATMSRIAKGIERYVVGAPDPFIVELTHHGARRVPTTAEPLSTITSAHRGEKALAAPTLVPILNTKWSPDRVDAANEPIRTITAAKGGEFAVAVASLGRQFGRSVGSDVADPVGAITAGGGGKTQVIAATLGRQFGSNVAGNDINEPSPTIMGEGGGGKLSVIAAHLTTYYGMGVNAGEAADPVRTVTGKDRHGLVTTFLEQANTGMVGHDLREGVSTITGRATQQRLIEARLRAIGALPDSRRRAVLRFLWDHFGEPTEAEWADPTGTTQARLRFGLVILHGQTWEIADIGMRMLKVRELFNAQGFPADYIIDRDPWGNPITGTAATLMVGNSVPPPLAYALAAANLNDNTPAERMAA
ncbi:DNA cytosine methyltransferase [Brevundimonas aurantiaca]|uniref:DNA cytosine methyltransferase n=1 Tax=Brevundimonas aurantiaca TaxID=74316 RepID=UPI00301A7A5D